MLETLGMITVGVYIIGVIIFWVTSERYFKSGLTEGKGEYNEAHEQDIQGHPQLLARDGAASSQAGSSGPVSGGEEPSQRQA